MSDRRILLANPRGFCAGVDRAIEIVESALARFGTPVFVRHEIVHNRHVVERLRSMGAVFVEGLDQVPDGSITIFSAHGVSRAVVAEGGQRSLKVIDATCPLVTKVHREIVRHVEQGYQVVLIGHAGHPEVEGAMGQVDLGRVLLVESRSDVDVLTVNNPDLLAYVTQTTLSIDDASNIIAALQERFPGIHAPKREDICYATTNRQQAVKQLAAQCSVILVIGSSNSSNSNRLRETAQQAGAVSYLIDDSSQIDAAWLMQCQQVGVTAGASAPEVLIKTVIQRLIEIGFSAPAELPAQEETVIFSLPQALKT